MSSGIITQLREKPRLRSCTSRIWTRASWGSSMNSRIYPNILRWTWSVLSFGRSGRIHRFIWSSSRRPLLETVEIPRPSPVVLGGEALENAWVWWEGAVVGKTCWVMRMGGWFVLVGCAGPKIYRSRVITLSCYTGTFSVVSFSVSLLTAFHSPV